MPQSNQDYTAGRFQSFDAENAPPRYDAGYECVLPPGVRTELAGLRRPPIPPIADRPTRERVRPEPRGPLYFVLLLVTALLIGGTAITLWRQRDAERAKTNKAISQPLAPQPTPTPGPTVYPWREYIAQHPEQFPYANGAPRAALVKLPPPRAQLIRLPEWRVGEERQLLMPYGLKVLGRLKGCLAAEWMLPQEGNVIGDTWIVGETPWVWVCPVGGSVPTWIDP